MPFTHKTHPGRQRITSHGLFTDIRGAADAPALLFLHGGPGQGCYDFIALQGDRLSRSARVVGLDQRGVDRSAPLAADSGLTVADLVEDCEEARRALGIDQWSVLGQSFGGGLALRYATAYPGSVTAVIFENPVWDLVLSLRAAIPQVAAMLADRGLVSEAQAALAAVEQTPQASRAAYVAALEALGDDREEFFVSNPATRDRLAEVRSARQDSEPQDDQAAGDEGSLRHHRAISGDDACYESLLPLLPRLNAPALLIAGGCDPITSPEQREAFRQASPVNRLVEFTDAGHFVHADLPDAYAAAVGEFLRVASPGTASAGPGNLNQIWEDQ